MRIQKSKRGNSPPTRLKKKSLLSIILSLLTALLLITASNKTASNESCINFISKKNLNIHCAEYDPLMPTEDESTDVYSDAEAMRILEEENDPPAPDKPGGSAAAAAEPGSEPGSGDPGNLQHESAPSPHGEMDTIDNARLDPPPDAAAAAASENTTVASGAAIFKSPPLPQDGTGPRQSGSGSTIYSGRSNSSSDSEYSRAFSSCERNELPPLYHTVKKARASALAPRILGGGPDPHFFDRFGDFTSDPRHVFASHHHSFEKKKNISTSFNPTDMTCNTCENRHPILERGGALV
jgi:hypothetical protein